MRSHSHSRHGAVAVQIVICLIVLLGVAAITVDGGFLYDQRRRVQAAADAAALAAADELYRVYPQYNGLDGSGSVRASALRSASANGYSNDGVHSTVTVNIPPQSGIAAGQRGHVEVTVRYSQPGYFSGIFGSANAPVSGRAVARGRWTGNSAALIALAPTLKGALTASGNGTVSVGGSGGAQINSNHSEAVVSTGGGGLTAAEYDVAGVPGLAVSGGGTIGGTFNSGAMPMPDPLAYIPAVNPATLTTRSSSAMNLTNDQVYWLQPGIYVGGIKVTNGLVVMTPGIYYFQGGGFSATGHATIYADGVMMYNAGGTISINEPGSVTINPMTSGIYKGISIFQDRTSDAPVNLAGNGSMTVSGTLYAARGRIKLTGNGATNVMGSQVIGYDIQLGGNGNISIAWNSERVAKARAICLIE